MKLLYPMENAPDLLVRPHKGGKTMKLYFYGADKEVTGSCHCLEACGKTFLIDCGLQQGGDDEGGRELPFKASQIDFVIVTHAHIDHSGRLPLLIREGFRGRIFATGATCDLLEIMLLDSARIQEMDAELENRKGRRAGREEAQPLYTVQDAENTLYYLTPCVYGQTICPAEGVSFTMTDAGHLLGSASVTIRLTEGDVTKTIVFSGDIGSPNRPIIRDPQYLTTADYVVMESTYGNREHDRVKDYREELAKIIDDTLTQGGNVVIPSFAVGRTQELLYLLREIKEQNLVVHHPNFPVYVDSPLSARATNIYSGDLTGYADEETVEVIKSGYNPIRFPDLRLCESVEESKMLNADGIPKVIISSSGMCEAGRIRHHLKHNLWRKESSILFVGYQAEGTLGRRLIDGVPSVKLFGEEIVVMAKIYNFRALSAHADKTGLLRWITSFSPIPRRVFVVHGEAEAAGSFAAALQAMGYQPMVPNYLAAYDLLTDQVISEGLEPSDRPSRQKKRTSSSVYARLVAAGRRLLQVIAHNEGGANKDLAKFADQITSLCDKWDR